jgi:hypothetical protein
MLVPLHCLVMPPNMPAGLDWAVIGLWVTRFRKTPQACDPPIVVVKLPCGLWRIEDGRHRYLAAHIAGRTHIDAVEA